MSNFQIIHLPRNLFIGISRTKIGLQNRFPLLPSISLHLIHSKCLYMRLTLCFGMFYEVCCNIGSHIASQKHQIHVPLPRFTNMRHSLHILQCNKGGYEQVTFFQDLSSQLETHLYSIFHQPLWKSLQGIGGILLSNSLRVFDLGNSYMEKGGPP